MQYCDIVSDGYMTYLTANTIQFTRSYLSFCDDLLRVYSANRHQLITSAFTDIFTAHVNCLQRAASSDKFKHEVITDQIISEVRWVAQTSEVPRPAISLLRCDLGQVVHTCLLSPPGIIWYQLQSSNVRQLGR